MPVEFRGVSFDDSVLTTTLKEGANGPAVGTLQALLKSHGAPEFGKIDNDFGPKTKAAVYWFQHSANVAEDGIVGPMTWKKLCTKASEVPVSAGTDAISKAVVAIKDTRAQALMLTAAKELGKKEIPDGSNDGPEVDKYTDDHAEPWCADFVSWCLKQQSWNPLPRRQPSCSGMTRWAQAQSPSMYFKTGDKDPMPGDIFMQLQSGEFGVDTGHSHTGFVLSYDQLKGEIVSIEGNASNAVRSFTRSISRITGFVRVLR
jgi:hypothetical protein